MLVLSQPDLGTSVLIALSGIAVIWLAGINIKFIVYSFLGLVISFPFVISMLKPYQKLRILTFINPDRDPLGAGYQIIQSIYSKQSCCFIKVNITRLFNCIFKVHISMSFFFPTMKFLAIKIYTICASDSHSWFNYIVFKGRKSHYRFNC